MGIFSRMALAFYSRQALNKQTKKIKIEKYVGKETKIQARTEY